MSTRQLTIDEATGEAIAEEMRRDPSIFLMGEGVDRRDYGPGLFKEFGSKRIICMPISEPGYTGVGLGAALTGMRPIVRIGFVDLMPLAMDQLLNQVGKVRYMLGGQVKVPLVIIAPTGAAGGAAAQHSQSLEGLFVHTPGIRVVVPSTPYDTKGLLKTALRENNPTVYLPSKPILRTRGSVPSEDYAIPFGKAAIRKEGKDVTVVAWSRMALRALEAAEKLNKEGVSAEVIDPRTLVPFDYETVLVSLKKTGSILIVEEECKRGAAGAEVASTIADEGFRYLRAPVRRVAAENVPIPYSQVLETFVIPQVDDIVNATKDVVKAKQ
jgi:pyruvate/2-oxoglutarate/acetoin dehydrogenase E1 component